MTDKKGKGKEVVLIGCLYEKETQSTSKKPKPAPPKVEMGKFMLSIPKDLRRSIKFESDEKGFGNASAYICHILKQRNLIHPTNDQD